MFPSVISKNVDRKLRCVNSSIEKFQPIAISIYEFSFLFYRFLRWLLCGFLDKDPTIFPYETPLTYTVSNIKFEISLLTIHSRINGTILLRGNFVRTQWRVDTYIYFNGETQLDAAPMRLYLYSVLPTGRVLRLTYYAVRFMFTSYTLCPRNFFQACRLHCRNFQLRSINHIYEESSLVNR